MERASKQEYTLEDFILELLDDSKLIETKIIIKKNVCFVPHMGASRQNVFLGRLNKKTDIKSKNLNLKKKSL
jgi:hypothetical protein